MKKDKKTKILDKLIDLIYFKRVEICVNVNSKKICEFIPKIYYIGNGKTGSTSIKDGFIDVNVAHWHSLSYFETQYETDLLSSNNYDLYDLIIYIGNKYNFKPIIIECIRNPFDVGISSVFQHISKERDEDGYCELCQIKKYRSDNNVNDTVQIIKNYINNTINKLPYSYEMFFKHFNIDLLSSFDKDLNYYFNDMNNVCLLVLKFEDIKNWNEIINNNLPYKFTLKHENKRVNEFYQTIKENIKYSKKEFQSYLDCLLITIFYSNNEIDKLAKKFIKN
jgi:hypothetical protein